MRREPHVIGARDVTRDDQGAILLLAVFMGVFMAGILFYAVGIGETLLYREGMQDAADATVLAAATTHARGMNLIVLINQIMAALLGILVLFRLIEMLATLAIGACLALAFITGGSSAAAIPPLEAVRSGAHDAYTSLDPPVHEALVVLHTAETIVRDTIPALSEVSAVDAVVAHYSPPAAFGVAIPPNLTLPVEDDGFGVLCGYAGKDAGDVVSLPFEPLPGFVRNAISDAVQGLAQTASAYFCGQSGATAPTLTKKVTDKLPKLAARQQCESDANQAGTETDPSDDATASCLEVDQIETASTPDPDTGACTTECERGGPYDERLQDARVQCDPRATTALSDFSWQERSVDVEFRYTSLGWKPDGVRRPGPFRVVTGSNGEHPCGDVSAKVSPDYHVDVYRSPSDDTVQALCAQEPEAPVGSVRGTVQTVTITEVTEVFGCSHEKTITVPSNFGAAGAGTQGGSSQAPERVKSGLKLGDDNFQIRSVVIAREPPSFADRIVKVAAWNASDSPSLVTSTLGRLSAAQAEYFYDGDSPSSEWMWHRSWRARLKRLRAPDGKASSEINTNFGEACSKASSGNDGANSCSDAQQGLGQILDLSLH